MRSTFNSLLLSSELVTCNSADHLQVQQTVLITLTN